MGFYQFSRNWLFIITLIYFILMYIFYISPSVLPSRMANSVHVLKQCDSLAKNNSDKIIYLFSKRSIKDKRLFEQTIKKKYDLKSKNIKFITYFSRFNSFHIIFLAIISIFFVIFLNPKIIISRNLYASFFLSKFLKKKSIFEIHSLESGFRNILQLSIIKSTNTEIIVISNALKNILLEKITHYHNNISVLHDAGPSSIIPVNKNLRRSILIDFGFNEIKTNNWDFVIGYFGHLYKGRGIEIIQEMAIQLPNCLFLIFGGNDSEIDFWKKSNHSSNLHFKGFVDYSLVQKLIPLFDILLMPYQNKVYLLNDKYDTARWMSPMKMFEYLASGVPIIASDLPVLKEILIHENNSFLVKCDQPNKWVDAIKLLIVNENLYDLISKNAVQEFNENYSWDKRSHKIINLFK